MVIFSAIGCIGKPVFKFTRQEQLIVAFLAGALLLGTVVKEWRARHPKPLSVEQKETRER